MSMKKTFILGLDGLDYNLVEKWNLNKLQQEFYDKIKVPITKNRGFPFSPEVWGSFLTGIEISDMRFDRSGPAGKIMRLLISLRKRISLGFGIGKALRKSIKVHKTFPKLNTPTFVDMLGVSTINVPFYNYNDELFVVLHQFALNEISMQQAVNWLFDIYEKRKKQIKWETKEKLKRSNIIFAYIHFPDAIQHFLFIRPHLIKKHYIDLEKFVFNLKTVVDGRNFLIVSDHGFDFKSGLHSGYGFYSSNVQLTPKPQRITDFHHIISQMLD